MHRVLSVITKSPDVSTVEFRRFMREDYGPVYQALPEVRAYRQSFLSPLPGSDEQSSDEQSSDDRGPDAVVEIAFDSPAAMRAALDNDEYRAAVERRRRYMARFEARVLDAVNVLA